MISSGVWRGGWSVAGMAGVWLMVGGGCASFSGPGGGAASAAAARRTALLRLAAAKKAAAIPALRVALEDENAVVRRTAARLLAGLGKPAAEALEAALKNGDALVRTTALRALCGPASDGGPAARAALLARALDDPAVPVRLYAVQRLATLRPRTPAVEAALRKAEKDRDKAIRAVATRADWPFHRNVVSIRDRSDWDHEVAVVRRIPLPKAGWRFRLDPRREGHRKGWYKPDFDDSGWRTIAIEQPWQKAGYDYTGVAWYRRTVELPEKPADFHAVDLAFGGVDECAWVWVNGQYAGDHDIGPSGWNLPFHLDVTGLVKWGAKNQITVRAMNTAYAGGIWRPAAFEVLK